MNEVRNSGDVWSLVKPAAGLLVLGVIGLALVGVFMGITSALISFASWVAIRVLPILAVGALFYWIARETGLLAKLRR
ncbi:MAG TPA: hypothetical protein DCL54_10165 [Alphaproteobacteria bacterium]|nr:hypothetical protein [Alphaproteobacteria bacterium]HAJ46931.1 hypothetical protein [Alphaproteobacteria bacterium]